MSSKVSSTSLPSSRSPQDWHQWRSSTGQTFLRGGPGAFMWVPTGTPHAFANTTDRPVRMFFQSSLPGGHDNYFDQLAEVLRNSNGTLRSSRHRRASRTLRHRPTHGDVRR
jgi:oxalate decarboxylase/phosphoglucose isomerase-like protein (cupin superfamily)